ncbi:unnamed protein product [Musa acuminata var. zebrina]
MGDLPDGEGTTPLEPRWSWLTLGDRIWADDASSGAYLRGALIPAIVKQVYSSPSEVLIDKAAKSLVWS